MWVLNLTKLRINPQKYRKVGIKIDHNTAIAMYTPKYKQTEENNFPSRQLVLHGSYFVKRRRTTKCQFYRKNRKVASFT